MTGIERWTRKLLLGLCCILLVCSLFACKGVEITGKTENVAGYTQAQAMVVLISERNRYQNVYTEQIWSVPAGGQDGETFGAYFTEQVRTFLQDIKTLNLMAQAQGVAPSAAEKDKIRQMAEDFYGALTQEDLDAMDGCTEEDVRAVYTDYFTADKMAKSLLSGVNTEVADADAKIIRVEQIELSDRAQAEQLAKDVLLEGANFDYYARQYSENTELERTLARGEEESAYYDAAFALEQDGISGVVEQGGKYYILKCLDAYDEDATLARKQRLQEALRLNAFSGRYEEYASQHIVRFREPFWEQIDLSEMPESRADNFFDVYETYAP